MREPIVKTFLNFDGVMQAPAGPEKEPSCGFQHGNWVAGCLEELERAIRSEPTPLRAGA